MSNQLTISDIWTGVICSTGSVTSVYSGLSIGGIGRVSLPISADDATSIKNASSPGPSSVWHLESSKVDVTYPGMRCLLTHEHTISVPCILLIHAVKVVPIGLSGWPKQLASMVESACHVLAVRNSARVRARLHELLLYEPGAYSTSAPYSQSTDQDGTAFASLNIMLPGSHQVMPSVILQGGCMR